MFSKDDLGQKDLTYNSHLEHLISSEAEKALVLSWLHNKSNTRYSKFNTAITIPVIVLSTLAGTASIGQTALFGEGLGAPVAIGLVSIMVGILNTVGSFFGWAKLAEGHRISGVNYSKLHRWISIELALPREQRVPAKHFLKEVRGQIDRLNETSPRIPPEVIRLFSKKMKKISKKVTLPEVCNEIRAVDIYPEGESPSALPLSPDDPIRELRLGPPVLSLEKIKEILHSRVPGSGVILVDDGKGSQYTAP